ncbi:NAD(P)-binding protein, partial [Xanthomonas citri pv. citri]|nr:NAD(P)-binding protein [Xanthomonas citri pv. citri]
MGITTEARRPPHGGRRAAVVVGAGPNGLTAAALLAREGWEVDV